MSGDYSYSRGLQLQSPISGIRIRKIWEVKSAVKLLYMFCLLFVVYREA